MIMTIKRHYIDVKLVRHTRTSHSYVTLTVGRVAPLRISDVLNARQALLCGRRLCLRLNAEGDEVPREVKHKPGERHHRRCDDHAVRDGQGCAAPRLSCTRPRRHDVSEQFNPQL